MEFISRAGTQYVKIDKYQELSSSDMTKIRHFTEVSFIIAHAADIIGYCIQGRKLLSMSDKEDGMTMDILVAHNLPCCLLPRI